MKKEQSKKKKLVLDYKEFRKWWRHSRDNLEEIRRSKMCGCYKCLSIFPSRKVWRSFGENACCPYCNKESVIGDASGAPITPEWLKAMKKNDASSSPYELKIKEDKKGKFGLVNKKGTRVVKPQYDGIDSQNNYGFIQFFRVRLGGTVGEQKRNNEDDLFEKEVYEGARFGYLDSEGKVIIEPILTDACKFECGIARASLDNKWGFVDVEGRWAIEPRFEMVRAFFEGLAAAKIDGKWGYIDRKGEMVIEPKYDHVSDFSDDVAEVSADGATTEYIDSTGAVIDKIYDTVGPLVNGALIVSRGGKYGMLDKNGKLCREIKYDSIEDAAKGMAKEETRRQTDVTVFRSLDGLLGLLDSEGRIICEAKYNRIAPFKGGSAVVEMIGRLGVISESGREIVPCQTTYLIVLDNGMAAVRLWNGWEVVDASGNCITPPLYKLEALENGEVKYPHEVEHLKSDKVRLIFSGM